MIEANLEGMEPIEVLEKLIEGLSTLLENDPEYFVRQGSARRIHNLVWDLLEVV